MKKSTLLLLLLAGAIGNLCAQNRSDKSTVEKNSSPFFISPDAIRDSFYIGLDKYNSLQITLSNLNDIQFLQNTDSIISSFKNDIASFEDSLNDPLQIKKINYLTDESGRTFIQIEQINPQEKSFLLTKDQTAAVKIAQDTVRIIRTISGGTGNDQPDQAKRWAVMTFVLNDYHQLFQYENSGLDSAIARLYNASTSRTHWTAKNNHNMQLTGNYSLSDFHSNKKAVVYQSKYHENDYLSLLADANLQNVYQHITPSASLGVKFTFPKKGLIRELKLGWEPMFLFAKNSQGVLHTYRNDWIMAQYGIYPLDQTKKYPLTGNLSLSYLIREKGGYFKENTFRLGLGGIGFGQNKLSLQPVIYFHNFFRGVTPGLRLSVGF